jgi:hypothetical protein
MAVHDDDAMVTARRRFLASCGKFAAITPPAVTLLLSAADADYAVALSGAAQAQSSGARSLAAGGGPRGNNGFGNGGADGVPGRSGSNASPNAAQKREDQVR